MSDTAQTAIGIYNYVVIFQFTFSNNKSSLLERHFNLNLIAALVAKVSAAVSSIVASIRSTTTTRAVLIGSTRRLAIDQLEHSLLATRNLLMLARNTQRLVRGLRRVRILYHHQLDTVLLTQALDCLAALANHKAALVAGNHDLHYVHIVAEYAVSVLVVARISATLYYVINEFLATSNL